MKWQNHMHYLFVVEVCHLIEIRYLPITRQDFPVRGAMPLEPLHVISIY
jgi:hypothetical protein